MGKAIGAECGPLAVIEVNSRLYAAPPILCPFVELN